MHEENPAERLSQLEIATFYERSDLMYQFLSIYSTAVLEKMDTGTGDSIFVSDAYILGHIICHPGTTVSAMASHYSRTRSFLSQVVSRLSAAGYIEKHPAEQDAGTLHLYPTEKGRTVNASIIQKRGETTRDVFLQIAESCSKEDVSAFFKVIKNCIHILNPEDPFFQES